MNRNLYGWATAGVVVIWLAAAPSAFAQGEQILGSTVQSSSQMSAPLFAASSKESSQATSKASSRTAEADAPSPRTCRTDSDCPSNAVCHFERQAGWCEARPSREPPKSSSSLLEKGSELYLRDRAVQLREELALGKGPVIWALANIRGVSAATLGRTLRSNRTELVELIGDASASDWAARFLRRLEVLCEG